jgi:DNA-binding NarL/FixJ family response regulator
VSVQEQPTVLLADDHTPLRRGVRVALEQSGFRVVAECSDAPSAVQAALRYRPAICLLDIGMPGSGIEAAREIKAKLPEANIIMLTVSRDDKNVFAALQAGASGYLLKDTDPQRLGHTLHGVLAGEAALPRALVQRLIDEFRQRRSREETMRRLESEGVMLTRREWEVLELMSEGMSTTEIAARLVVAPATVRSHVASTLKKLHAGSRDEALKRFE